MADSTTSASTSSLTSSGPSLPPSLPPRRGPPPSPSPRRPGPRGARSASSRDHRARLADGARPAADRQADIVRTVIDLIARNSEELNITGYIHHSLRDSWSAGAGLLSQFGLMTDDYGPKPAFHVYQELIAACGLARLAVQRDLEPDGLAVLGRPRSPSGWPVARPGTARGRPRRWRGRSAAAAAAGRGRRPPPTRTPRRGAAAG